MLVKDILERVTTLYNDSGYARISQRQYLQFLDDAINQLILSRPDAYVKTAVVNLVVGTRQSIPEDAYSLIDIYMNKGADGSNGAPILQVERKNLDYFSNWQQSVRATVIDEFAYDMRTPKTFWVSPPSDGTSRVEMDYSARPIAFANMPDDFDSVMLMEIPVDGVFKGPIISYMLYLLYSTDSSSEADRNVAARYEQSFYQALGIEYQAAAVAAPTLAETRTGVPVSA